MGISPSVEGRAPIHAFYSPHCWIEGAALRQLETIAALPGVKAVAAMPDLHPGKYGPVGCAALAEAIHPQLIGSDIGCGMGLFQLDAAVRKLRLDKLAERLRALEDPWDGDADDALIAENLPRSPFDGSIGSIGGGNHFCELQAIEDILDPEEAAAAGLDRSQTYVLTHSGSRGLGYAVFGGWLAAGGAPLDPASDAGRAYLVEHEHAVRWARVNRRAIAGRAARAARADPPWLVADLGHNLAELVPGGVLHRKGAAPADRGLAPIPGSRGTLSYLVKPLGGHPEALASLAHGAGRKYDRAAMRDRASTAKSNLARLARNPFGGLVVCEDRALLFEEAPEAYKSIDRVIDDLTAFGLARVVATFRPLVTYKRAAAASGREPARVWRREARR